MKRSIVLLIAICPLFVFSQYVLQEGFISLETNEKVHDNFTFKHLRIYPLIGGDQFQDAHQDIGIYTNLEEALEQKKVIITEKGGEVQQRAGFNNDELQEEDYSRQQIQNQQTFEADGEVNKLFVENVSQDTIYLMAGEVVKGGKQDRILASDMILPPESGKIELSVFCVEHGRWSYKSDASGFTEYYTVSANSVRGKAVKEKNQYEVWDAVELVVESQDAESGSGTLTALKDADDYNKSLEEYAEHFSNQLKQMDNCIGFVGVTGDRIIGCDIFATSELFKKQSNNLMDAYISEAISEGENIKIKDKEVLAYLNEFLSDESTQDEVVKTKGMQYKYNGRKLHLNTY